MITNELLIQVYNRYINSDVKNMTNSEKISWLKKLERIPDFQIINYEQKKFWINKLIKYDIIQVFNGDVIYWLDKKMLFFWHEQDGIILPYIGIDSEGSVPPCFRVGNKFYPDHWINSIYNNSIVFLSDEVIEEIEQHVLPSKIENHRYCGVEIQDRVYGVTICHMNPIRIDFDYYNGCLYQE
jgi:hypothetical protein